MFKTPFAAVDTALAIKLIMQNPQEYGYYVRKRDLYPPIPYTTVQLSGQNVDLYQFAKDNGTTYKMLRELNPWFNNDKIANKSNKTYTVKIPVRNGTKTSPTQKARSASMVPRL